MSNAPRGGYEADPVSAVEGQVEARAGQANDAVGPTPFDCDVDSDSDSDSNSEEQDIEYGVCFFRSDKMNIYVLSFSL